MQIDQPRPQLTVCERSVLLKKKRFQTTFVHCRPNRRECVLHFRKHALCFRRRDRKSIRQFAATVRCTGPVMTEPSYHSRVVCENDCIELAIFFTTSMR